MNYSHLAIHSKYEICSGTREHKDYIKKAKFLGIDHLGICDHNTLGGTLSFQEACKKAQIGYSLGMTATVQSKATYLVKLYVKNKTGWQNLLRINKAIKVDNDGFIVEKELLERSSGLILVIPPDSINYFNKAVFYKFSKQFKDIYFQFDPVEYKSNERDKEHLLNLKQYLHELYPICPPVLMSDSYYLDKSHAHIKPKLAKIGKVPFSYASDDQHFKSIDELFFSLSKLFKGEDDRLYDIFAQSAENSVKIADKCKFEIETGKLHLPKYIMTDEEKEQYGTTNNMFDNLIMKGLIRIGKENDQKYLDRIEYETSVIDLGGYREYFLITYDICREADKRGIMRNLGRGSAASSLCLYLMNVTMIDPLEYNLPFDRFLNSARVTKGLPDVDIDFSSEGREKIKQYIVQKYGYNHTAYVGTWGLLKIKSALKELAKENGTDFQTINYITGTFPKKVADEPQNITELFKYSQEVTVLKKFIKENIEVVNDLPLVNNVIRNKSIHASAIIIFPHVDEEGNEIEVWDWIPVRKEDGIIVSEYSGTELDKLGFLKEDILGLSQLDKVGDIFKIVKEKYGKEYNFQNIPLDDKKVFWMFNDGYTADVFQFSGGGMTGFLMDMRPDKLNDLIAANALYRPGAMGTGSHIDYIKIKNGERLPEYLWGLEEITKETYGILAYQEQVMRACVDLAGFSLADSDMIRKGIGKKDQELLNSYKPQFIEGAIKNGCPKEEAEHIWNMFESFGQYSFNYSHAACYTILGYTTMYLKAHYPVAFYNVALQYADDSTKPQIIAEMNRLGEVMVSQPDINHSGEYFKPDFDKKKIYWSLVSVKWVGEKAVEKIIEERNNKGNFFSVKDLFDRVDKRTVNKRAITNLILAGAFDELYNVKQESDRIKILREYYEEIIKEDLPEEFNDFNNIWKNHWWILKSLELTGLGYINYKELIQSSSFASESNSLIDLLRFNQEESIGQEIVVSGVIEKIIERKSKRGKFVQIDINVNSEMIHFTLWNEEYEKYKKVLKNAEKSIIFIKGIIKHDGWKKCNVLHSNENTKVEII